MIRTSLRSSEARPSAMNPARSPVSGATVSSQLLDESRAYVRIRQFTEQTPAELVDSLNGLSRAAPEGLGGIVLDLRDNPGGLLRAAVAVSAVFLPEDSLVLYTDGAGKESKARYLARPDFYLKGGQADILAGMPGIYKSLPLIVLVNGMSASAAEIVAGALKDHGRAKIVGTVTYGKGTVQRVVSLADNTAIKFTMAYYYSPNGHRIQQQGVKPDVVVDNQSFSAGDECGMGSSESRDFASVVVDNSADDEDCQLRHAIHLLH
jgi:carboxyl-terminal processing protease